MDMSEVVERGFTVAEDGRVLDEYGNEYRDEEGMVCYVNEGSV
jgi:hypothetical protein